jgi:4-hydroxy-3-methylbut-2-enyl diphosphate reductase IspH
LSATPTKPPLRVVFCAPRRFCAGVARAIEAFIAVGASDSSNSERLREGCAAQVVADARAIDWRGLEGLRSIAVALETLTTATVSMAFPLPCGLRPAA